MTERKMTNEKAIEILSDIRAYYSIFYEYDEPKYAALSKAIFALKAEPVQPTEFEWCTDCKEYDQEAHCCHRWTKVIRNAVNDLKAQGYEPVKHGHWEDDNEEKDTKYCPHCGAKMEEEDETD